MRDPDTTWKVKGRRISDQRTPDQRTPESCNDAVRTHRSRRSLLECAFSPPFYCSGPTCRYNHLRNLPFGRAPPVPVPPVPPAPVPAPAAAPAPAAQSLQNGGKRMSWCASTSRWQYYASMSRKQARPSSRAWVVSACFPLMERETERERRTRETPRDRAKESERGRIKQRRGVRGPAGGGVVPQPRPHRSPGPVRGHPGGGVSEQGGVHGRGPGVLPPPRRRQPPQLLRLEGNRRALHEDRTEAITSTYIVLRFLSSVCRSSASRIKTKGRPTGFHASLIFF